MSAPQPAAIAAHLADLVDLMAADEDDPWPLLGLLLQRPDDEEPLALAVHPVDGPLAEVVDTCPAAGECVGIAVAYPAAHSPFPDHHTATHPGHHRATVALSHDDGVVVYRYPSGATTTVPLNGRLLRQMRELWSVRLCAEEDHRLGLRPGNVS